MNRRSFFAQNMAVAALGSAALDNALAAQEAANPASPQSPREYYQFVTLRLQSGPQVSRMLGWFEKRAFPIFEKHKFGPIGIFNVNVGPDIPSVVAIIPYLSLAQMESLWAELASDPDWRAARGELDTGDPPFYREDVALRRATPFAQPLKATAPGEPAHKVYELRIYESPTERQLGYLHNRFAGGEIDVFHKSGIHPVLYSDTLIGPNMPNMAYLIPFENEGSRENAWAAFGQNPDWQRIRDESVRKGGEIVRNITNMFLSPASFSMLR
jgi:NIPSNAP